MLYVLMGRGKNFSAFAEIVQKEHFLAWKSTRVQTKNKTFLEYFYNKRSNIQTTFFSS